MDIKEQILKTLIYSDIFSYPLTQNQLWDYLISDNHVSKTRFISSLKSTKGISKTSNSYTLNGREKLVERVKKIKDTNLLKVQIANKAAIILSVLPTIELIGISGSVSMLNANEDEDIDLVVFCHPKTIYITRLLATLILDYKNLRRKKNDTQVKDKICLNLFMTSEYKFKGQKQNLYIAHELVQLRPIIGVKGSYAKILSLNKWVDSFLPNGRLIKRSYIQKKQSANSAVVFVFIILDLFVKYPQMLWIKRGQTQEYISNDMLAFHKRSSENKTLLDYKNKLTKYSLRN